MKCTRIALLAFVFVALGCSTLEVSIKSQPGVDFSKFRTFSVGQVEAADDAISVDIFRDAVVNALQTRGLARVEKGGDLVISATFTAEAPPQERNGTIGPPTLESGKGVVTIDAVDQKVHATVWSAAAHEELARGSGRGDRQRVAEEVARKIFDRFPVGTKKK